MNGQSRVVHMCRRDARTKYLVQIMRRDIVEMVSHLFGKCIQNCRSSVHFTKRLDVSMCTYPILEHMCTGYDTLFQPRMSFRACERAKLFLAEISPDFPLFGDRCLASPESSFLRGISPVSAMDSTLCRGNFVKSQ